MTAWQPSRESVVSSHAVSSRSASSSCISLRFWAPFLTITWHVVHAQLPPHACSRPRSKCLDTSRNDSGLPWFEYGSLPTSNSTVFDSPSMMKVTLGIWVLGLPFDFAQGTPSGVGDEGPHYMSFTLLPVNAACT